MTSFKLAKAQPNNAAKSEHTKKGGQQASNGKAS